MGSMRHSIGGSAAGTGVDTEQVFHTTRSVPSVMVASVLVSWALMFAPYVLIQGMSRQSLLQAAAALVICAIAFGVFYLLEPRREGIYPATAARWLRQAGIVLLATLAAGIF